MKIVVVGSRGLIGSKTVPILRAQGHNVVATSTKTGVNSVTGEGLAEAFSGADAVVDVTNAPSWEDDAVMAFFDASTRNMLAAAKDAGVKHFVALSVVGTAGLQQSGYFRAKQKQEDLIRGSGLPYTIVQATQFFEFMSAIADFSTTGDTIKLSTAQFQPIAADDVAAAVAERAASAALNGTLEIAGPQRAPMCSLLRDYLASNSDARKIVPDASAPYYGMVLEELSLVPQSSAARLMPTTWQAWAQKQQHVAAAT